jgi:hypothetical protein
MCENAPRRPLRGIPHGISNDRSLSEPQDAGKVMGHFTMITPINGGTLMIDMKGTLRH